MKWLVPFFICMAFLSCSTDKQANNSQFYASVAESVITPPIGTFIIEPRGEISTGVHDEESEMAILYSYPAHPVSVHATSTEFSADFPGYAARHIQEQYPGVAPLFLQV